MLSQGVRADTAEQEAACGADDESPAHPAKRPRSALAAVAALQAEVEGSTDQGAVGLVSMPCALQHAPVCYILRDCCQHTGLRNKLRKLVYVGAVTPSHILVQEDTSLLLLDMGKLSKDLFYQKVCMDGCMRRLLQGSCSLVYGAPLMCVQILDGWGKFSRVSVANTVRVAELALLAIPVSPARTAEVRSLRNLCNLAAAASFC